MRVFTYWTENQTSVKSPVSLVFYTMPSQAWELCGLLFWRLLLGTGRSLAWMRPQHPWHMCVPFRPVLVDHSGSSGNESPQPVWRHLVSLPGHLSGDPREIFLSYVTPSTLVVWGIKNKIPTLEFPLRLICKFTVICQMLWLFLSFSTVLYAQEVRDGSLLAVLLSVLLLATVYIAASLCWVGEMVLGGGGGRVHASS